MSKTFFQYIFPESQWNNLPLVIQKHYSNRLYTSDITKFEGKIDIEIGFFGKLLAPIMKLIKVLPWQRSKNVPTTVYFKSNPTDNNLYIERIFHLRNNKKYFFNSKMVIFDQNIIEYTTVGIGWFINYKLENQKVLMTHLGYKIKVFGKTFTIPLEFLFGKINNEEEPLNDSEFKITMIIDHKLFGKIYQYSGIFKIVDYVNVK